MIDKELKPCPFCGNVAVEVHYGYNDRMYQGWLAYCKRCFAETDQRPSEDEVISAWNKRAVETELLRAVEELVHEQCQITCKDHEKECEPDCWVRKHKELIAKVKGGTNEI